MAESEFSCEPDKAAMQGASFSHSHTCMHRDDVTH